MMPDKEHTSDEQRVAARGLEARGCKLYAVTLCVTQRDAVTHEHTTHVAPDAETPTSAPAYKDQARESRLERRRRSPRERQKYS
jgi:hypothetical protein